VYATYDVDKRTIAPSDFPQRATVMLDPGGDWTIVSEKSNGIANDRLSPSIRFDLARSIPQDSDSRAVALFMMPRLPDTFLDSLAIRSGRQPLQPRVPHLLVAEGWSRGRRRIQPSLARWRSLTPEIAAVDSLGVLTATDTGRVVIELSAGGWRRVVDTVLIASTPTVTLVDEKWDSSWNTRWRPFGDPQPAVVADAARRALLNNGDGNFLSGLHLNRPLDAEEGLTIDFDVSTPITRTQWQIIHVGMPSFMNANHIERWDHKTGYIAAYVDDAPNCSFSYPAGEGDAALTGTGWYASMQTALDDSSFKPFDGRWYHVRLQLFPGGRCGIAINGKAVMIMPGLGPPRAPILPVIQGNSVGTRVLVGHLVIKSGVPDDIDWSALKYDGYNWLRAPESPNASRSQRSSR
jgi:hypothetical protein